MGKQTNAQVLRFLQNEDWISKYYSSSFNYSNLITQDFLIHDYMFVIQIYEGGEESV